MVGASFGNVCYNTNALAASAFFQSVAPVINASGSTVSYQFVANAWVLQTTTTAGKTTNVAAVVPVFPTCDTMAHFNDGLTYGSALAGVLVLASIAGLISRAR